MPALLRWEWLITLALTPLFIAPLAVPLLTVAAISMVLGLTVLRGVVNRNQPKSTSQSTPLFSTMLDVPIVILLLTLPGALWAVADWAAFIPAFSHFMYGIVMYYATVRCLRMGEQRQMLAGLTVLGVGVALIGLFTMRSPAQKLPLLQAVFDLIPRIKPPEKFGSTGSELGGYFHPNILAITLTLLLPFEVAAGYALQRRFRALCWLGCVLMGLVLLLTVSRTAMGALLVTVLMVGGFRWRWLWGAGVALSVVGVLVAWQFGLEAALGGTLSSATNVAEGLGGRSAVWRGAWQTLLDFPFVPVAFGSFNQVSKSVIGHLQQFQLSGWDYHAHNIVLEYAVNFGVFGLAAFIVILVTLGYKLWRHLHLEPDSLRIAAAISLLSFVLFGMVDALSPLNKTGFLFFVVAATVAAKSKPQQGLALPTRKFTGLPIMQTAAVALFVAGIMLFQFRASPMAAFQENVGLALFNQSFAYGFKDAFNDTLNQQRIAQTQNWLMRAMQSGSPTANGHIATLNRVFANLNLAAQPITDSVHLAGGELRAMQVLAPPHYAFGTPINPGAGGVLWWQGRTALFFEVARTARYTITVRAQHADPAPIHMSLGADNKVIRSVILGKGDHSWEDCVYEVEWTSGTHSVDVWFTNDGWAEDKDRNAAVESIHIQKQ